MKAYIYGSGNVGATCAYYIASGRLVEKIVLIDIDQKLAHATSQDIFHSTQGDVKVSAGDISELTDEDILIITAGAAGSGSQSRLELAETNKRIIDNITQQINQTGKNPWMMIVTNPVDVLTSYAYEKLNFKEKVFGTGTALETYRLRALVTKDAETKQTGGTETRAEETFVVGEHGDSAVITNDNFAKFTQELRTSAYEIISGRGATSYGIASVVGDIISALSLQNTYELTIPLSIKVSESLIKQEIPKQNIFSGWPAKVSVDKISPIEMPLSDRATQELKISLGILAEHV